MARNKKVEILSNDKEVLHPMTDGDCVIFEDGQTLAQKLSEDDSVKYTPEIVNSSPMFKVGEGNTVDYSGNVLDGAYERAILQGQTYVNYIQESSADEVTLPTPFTEYERTQHNTLTSNEEGTLGINLVGQSYVNALQHDSEEEYVVLGESLEFQEKKVEYTNEGQIKSAMLKGQTLVNLTVRGTEKTGNVANFTQENGYMKWNSTQTWQKVYYAIKDKPNTKYMVRVKDKHEQVGIYVRHNSTTASGDNAISLISHTVTGEQYAIFTSNDTGVFAISLETEAALTDIWVQDFMILEYQEGMENWDIPYFEGMQSVTVSTKLENLCHKHTTSSLAKTGKTFKSAGSINDRVIQLINLQDGNASSIYGMKPNTKYLVQFKISNLVLDGLSSLAMQFSTSGIDSSNCVFVDTTVRNLVNSNGIYRVVLTTSNVLETSNIEIKGTADQWENSGSSLRSMTISEIMYVEYQNGMENWNLPYFEDYQVMKPVQVESVNKNLQPQGTYSTNSANNVSYIAGSEGLIRINPAKRYRVSAGAEIKGCTMSWYDKSKNYIVGADANGLYPVTNPNAYYARLHINIDTNYLNTIQVEESDTSTATEYVPHQSKTTYSWDEVILRKVGDIEDTLDLTTGEWVQRIGEIVLDGSDDEKWERSTASDNKTVTSHFYYTLSAEDNRGQVQVICDNFVYNTATFTDLETEGIKLQYGDIGKLLWLNINKDKLNSDNNSSGIRQYLSQNPITVQYVLTTPIVHKVNLSRPNLQVYDDITHIHTKCLDGTLVPNIYLPSDISYPAILESNTTYNVSINHTEVNADNPLTVNVGGTEITMTDSRMILTTPATLANSNVSFTGKGNKIKESMLIKNSSLLTRDLPHFNGIGSVQLGKTIENLCDSTDSMYGGCVATKTVYNDHVSVTVTKTGSLVICSSLIRPLENGKKYFVYAPNTFPIANACHVGFYNYYNDTYNFGHQVKSVQTGKCIIEIDQKDKLYTMITLGYHSYLPTGTYTIQKPIICEYIDGMENWDWESIGYFTGTKNIGNEFMRIGNKNLFDKNEFAKRVVALSSSNNLNGDILTYDTTSTHEKRLIDGIFKPNTQYTIKLDVTFSEPGKGFYVVWKYKDGTNNSAQGTASQSGQTISFTLRSQSNKTIDYFYTSFGNGGRVSIDLTNVQIEEASSATSYVAHKHNGLYITKDQPIGLTWEQGRINPSGVGDSYTNAINNAVSYGIRNKGLLNLKPNTTYRLSLGDKTNYKYHIAVFDNSDNALSASSSLGISGDWVSSRDTIFTTTKDVHKIGINVQKQDSSSITPSEINHIRLEEVTDVVLRSIGDVHDELDIARGIYTQRIGEVTLDGSGDENWELNNTDGTTTNRFIVMIPTSKVTNDEEGKQSYLCDKLQKYLWSDTEIIGVTIIDRAVFLYNKNIDCSINALRDWLQSNPITVQYILATPIIHKVYIGNRNEANTEVAKPNDVFTLPTLYTEQTHIDLTNNGIMPKVQSRDYIAYPVLPMLSRTYTLQHNLTGGVSNLTIDLLGRTQSVSYQNHKSLVYTPETMDAKLHDELRISGKGKISKVMYIDGGYMDRDIPYIEGMKNAVNPIVKNIGKNLVQKIDNIWYFYDNTINGGGTKYNCGIAPVKPYNQYIINKTSILCFYDENGKCTNSPFQYFNANNPRTAPSGSKYMLVRHQGGDNTTYLDGLQVVEYGQEFDNQEYKENMCYVDCGEIRLTPDMFEQGSVNNSGDSYESDKNTAKTRIRTKELIELNPSVQYVILGDDSMYKYSAHFFDKDGMQVKGSYDLSWKANQPFTVPSDAPMAAFFVAYQDNRNFTVDDADFNFQLVKVSEIKQMRSLPNGVHDEIDLETGTYIQRIGEMTLNDNDYVIDYFQAESVNGYSLFAFVKSDIKNAIDEHDKTQALCDKLVYENVWSTKDKEGFFISNDRHRVFIRINNNKLSGQSVDALNTYLASNPITVQYLLAEPVVKDIVIHNYPHSYEDGHVIIENGDPNTPIPAQLTYRAVTNRSGQIQQHTEQVEKQEREINELETLILANIHLSQTR